MELLNTASAEKICWRGEKLSQELEPQLFAANCGMPEAMAFQKRPLEECLLARCSGVNRCASSVIAGLVRAS